MLDFALRGGMFALAACLLLAREWRVPAFAPTANGVARLRTNVLMAIVGVIVTRVLAPAGVAGVALLGAQHHWGVLQWAAVPEAVAGVVGILALDAAIYWQHRLFHRVPLLWRLHAVHHADPRIDVTTAVRFHPVELAVSLALKSAVVLALGCPAWAAAAFEVLLAVAALFNHANTRFSAATERNLRRLRVVTPDLHRVHHRVDPACQHRNFGFSITLWDRFFGTYVEPDSIPGEDGFGLAGASPSQAASLGSMLAMPLRGVPR